MIKTLTSAYRPKSIYDVCVIGGGAAGITVASKARDLGLSVFLAEGGGADISEESQSCYRGSVVGDEYFDLDVARLRYFGGTTNHWGGMCRPLEEHDFRPKAASPDTGWPISRPDLDPYFAEAAGILEIPAIPDDRILNTQETVRRIQFVFSPPVRFGTKFHDKFTRDADIEVCLNCNAVDVNFNGKAIETATFRNYAGNEIDVAARHFVLACGGIENSRLLLYWNSQYNNRLGNQGGNVGRYWMEHLTQTIGEFMILGNNELPGDDAYPPLSKQRLYLAPTAKFIEEEHVLNCRIRLDRVPPGALEGMLEWGARDGPAFLSETFEKALSDQRSLGWVRSSSEQAPDPANRVALGTEVDRFDIPRPVLHWKRSMLDKRSFQRFAFEVGAYLARTDIGRLKLNDWVLSDVLTFSCEGGGHCPGGYHHLGGTRMASTPASGVVDADCRVFGTENMYVAGSSVFPSGGYCNPTTSIVQLSLRLADHLRRAVI